MLNKRVELKEVLEESEKVMCSTEQLSLRGAGWDVGRAGYGKLHGPSKLLQNAPLQAYPLHVWLGGLRLTLQSQHTLPLYQATHSLMR